MSHLLSMKAQVTSQEALIRALKRMGFQVEQHRNACPLKGYHAEDKKVAHIIVRSLHTKIPSDIGWEFTKDGCQAHIDEYHYHDACYNKTWQNKLYTHYNVEVTKMAFEAKGIPCEESLDDKGRITLRAKFKAPEQQSRIRIGGR